MCKKLKKRGRHEENTGPGNRCETQTKPTESEEKTRALIQRNGWLKKQVSRIKGRKTDTGRTWKVTHGTWGYWLQNKTGNDKPKPNPWHLVSQSVPGCTLSYRYVVSSLEMLVAEDYLIIYMNGATPRSKMPGISWLKKCYQMIDRRWERRK